MSIQFWMISNRAVVTKSGKQSLGKEEGTLSFYTKQDDGKSLNDLANWSAVSAERFQKLLIGQADAFPRIPEEQHEDQKHVTIFVHGYNNSWDGAASRYEKLVRDLYAGSQSLGVCILFTWPSDGATSSYYPDRKDARESAEELADVLSRLYDWLLIKQADAHNDVRNACRAKVSVIAHSMGNYVLQYAMRWAWTRANRPLLVSLVNQLIMVAADVDNDLFKDGEQVGDADGEGISNLTYRTTALYSGRDSVLGVSAGLKHFGKRRLGRSGLDRKADLPDNVWDVDCSTLFTAAQDNIHSAYFEEPRTVELMRQILRGLDRGVLVDRGFAPGDRSVPVTTTPTTEH